MRWNDEDMEQLVLMKLVVFLGLPAAMTWLALKTHQATEWALRHQILVPKDAAMVPVTSTAGLDLIRVLIAVLMLAGFFVATASAVSSHRHRSRRRAVDGSAR